MRLTRRSLLPLLASLSVTVSMLSACSDASQAMPELPFTQIDGSKHHLTDLKGKVTLVNFWATSCSTCVKEMPDLVATHQKFKEQGFETLAIAMEYDPPAYVAQFVETRQLPFRVAIDHDGKLAEGFGKVELTPTTLVIDKKGVVVKKYIGEPDFAALHQLVGKLLAQ
jgi:peroxiredoxin